MTWEQLIPQIILAVIAATPGLLALYRGRHKEKADVAKAITDAAGELVQEYKDQLAKVVSTVKQQEIEIECQTKQLAEQAVELRRQAVRIMALEQERDEILQGVIMLCAQIRKLGLTPVWEPAPDAGQ